MDQFDIKEILGLLKKAIKLNDWEPVEEAIDYLTDFYEDGEDND
jgi:hypothetical protein